MTEVAIEPRDISEGSTEIRVNQEEDDDDYIDTLLSDARGAGGAEEGSDVAVGGAVAAGQETEAALRAVAYSTAVPVGWTPGYRVSEKDRAYGHDESERGWGMDPAALAIVSSSLHRSVSLGGTRLSGSEKAQIEGAYLRAVEANQATVLQAFRVRYDFKPRTEHMKHFPGMDPGPATKPSAEAFGLQKTTLSWALSVDYEIASRAFDRLWSMLSTTRVRRGVYSTESIVQRLKLIHMDFYQHREDISELKGFLDSFADFALEGPREVANAVAGAVRLLVRARNVDTEKRRYADLYAGSVSESALFGSNHRMVEDEALRCLWHHAQRLRYLFRHNNEKGAWTLSLRGPFRYDIGRAVISRTAADTARITALKQERSTAANDLQYGVRVVIPPAPEGYLRNNVLVAFRSLGDDERPTEKETDEIVHVLVAGAIPDTSAWIDPRDPSTSPRPIAGLPASLVLYHTRIFGAAHREKAPDGHHGHIVVKPEAPGDGSDPVADVWWEATYDLRWLQKVSGNRAALPSPTDNVILDSIFHSLYAYPYRSGTAASRYRKQYPKPWVQVFVEYVPAPETEVTMRRDRAKWFRQVTRKARGDSREEAQFLEPARSFTGMKDGFPFAPWSRDIAQKFAALPIVEDYEGASARIHTVIVESDSEKSRFDQTAFDMPSMTTTTTTTTTTVGDQYESQGEGEEEKEEEEDDTPELDTIITSSQVALDMAREGM